MQTACLHPIGPQRSKTKMINSFHFDQEVAAAARDSASRGHRPPNHRALISRRRQTVLNQTATTAKKTLRV